ncbi:replication/maintenance protein RepL [Peptostreptococcus faecalis]|uniref:replication/maintenance protein RepL n=1 Tax=Peptostreptococcus faecalis TaxID=2045015 RepID=UPI000C7D0A52|nr:replication/maintenance protein RepL [Peptostreptococcus faecalis]
MLEIKESLKKIDQTEYTESRNIKARNTRDRFLNISPKNYISIMKGTSSKKALIPMILINEMDKDNKIYMTLDELSKLIDYPKTSLSVIFSEYRKRDFMQKIRNGVYMINPLVSYKGSKYERDKLIKEYNKLKEEGRDMNEF